MEQGFKRVWMEKILQELEVFVVDLVSEVNLKLLEDL